MTRDMKTNTVTLSLRDWVGLVAILLTMSTLCVAAYLRHDRHLTEVLVKQDFMELQMEDLRGRIQLIESAITKRSD